MDEKQVPNPYGKLGGIEHRKKVEEVAQDVENRGLFARLEHFIRFISGKKRFVDVAALNKESLKPEEFHQIGKQTLKKIPVKRERDVIQEISIETGIKPIFHPYNNFDQGLTNNEK